MASCPKLNKGYVLGDKYTIEEFVFSGTDAHVYLAQCEQYGLVAVKVAHNYKSNGKLNAEAQIYRRLAHCEYSYFPVLLDKTKLIEGEGAKKRRIVLVMQLCGDNLSNLSKKEQKWGIVKGVQYGIECLKALQGLHSLGFIHGDVKPNNFVEARNKLWPLHTKLVDFGASKNLLTSITGWTGTSVYCSLYVHEEDHIYNQLDDLWSLLFCVIQLSTQKLPWKTTCEELKHPEKRDTALAGKKRFIEWINKEEKEQSESHNKPTDNTNDEEFKEYSGISELFKSFGTKLYTTNLYLLQHEDDIDINSDDFKQQTNSLENELIKILQDIAVDHIIFEEKEEKEFS